MYCMTFFLTIAGLGREVIFEAQGTTTLIHARRVDTFGLFFTDTGVHYAFIDIWKKVIRKTVWG